MLTSTRNSLVKQLRQLGTSTKERRSQQLFLVEGTHALIEAIATSYPLEIICCTEIWAELHRDLYAQCEEICERVEIVSEPVIEAIATTVSPDGVVAVAQFQPTANLEINSFGLALETIQDPGNLGTIIRSAVAVGVDGVLVSDDSVDLTHPKILRATAGQWFRCPMQSSPDLYQAVRDLQKQGVKAIATSSTAELTYWEFDFTQPSLILLGNEGNGLTSELMQLADVEVTIPMSDRVESLNVAVAAALLLYEAKRQRSAVGLKQN